MRLETALTNVAFDLLQKLNVGTRPQEVALRRAVSSAYYAVFHALCRLCADELVGVKAAQADRTAIYRSVDHGAVRSLLKGARLSSSVQNILAQTNDLQEQRHLADYDPEPQKFGGRAAVLSLVRSAEDTVAEITTLPSADRKTLAVALIARRRK